MKVQKSTIILSIALVIAVIIAIVFYSQLQAAKLSITSPADIFDANLHDLMQAHTFILTDTARRSAANSSATFNASLAKLQDNMNEIAALLTPIYGDNASELVSLWNNKTAIFVNYSISMKNNDTNALAYYNAAVAAYVPQAVTFWTTTSNPYPVIDQSTIQPLITQHLADVKATIDAWNSGNYTLYYNDLEISYDQMGTFADVIATAIIQQNSQYFL